MFKFYSVLIITEFNRGNDQHTVFLWFEYNAWNKKSQGLPLPLKVNKK